MKRILLALFLLITSLTYSQSPIYFYSYKMDVMDIENDKITHKTGDYMYLIDVKNKTLGFAVYNNDLQKYDVSKRTFETQYTSPEGMNSFMFKENGGTILVVVNTNNQTINIVDEKEKKGLVLHYHKFEIDKR